MIATPEQLTYLHALADRLGLDERAVLRCAGQPDRDPSAEQVSAAIDCPPPRRARASGAGGLSGRVLAERQVRGAGAERRDRDRGGRAPRDAARRELVRRELAACSLVVLRCGPDAGPEREVIERLLRRSFARLVPSDEDAPPGTPVVCVGLSACHDALAGRRHDLPLVLYTGTGRLDAQRMAASEAAYVPANTPISAAVWARAVASACAEASS